MKPESPYELFRILINNKHGELTNPKPNLCKRQDYVDYCVLQAKRGKRKGIFQQAREKE